MPGVLKLRKDNPKRPTAIRRKMKGEERALRAQESMINPTADSAVPETVLDGALPQANEEAFEEQEKSGEAALTAPDQTVVKKIRDGVVVEQTVTYNPGKKKPIVQARIRLTTAVRGKRKQDNLVTAAYLLRLEVLSATEGVAVEGLSLGPWQIRKILLEPGAMYLAEPIWAGFQPVLEPCPARILLGDASRNRLLDLPMRITVLAPGGDVFFG